MRKNVVVGLAVLSAALGGVPAWAVAPAYEILKAFENIYNPYGTLVRDSAGNLYGTSYNGGDGIAGTVFTLAPDGTISILHSFAFGGDGTNPYAGLALDATNGILYGTTYQGGSSGFGTVFKLATDGTGYTVLHHFTGGTTDGANPVGGVAFDSSSGFVYGTTTTGGASGVGTAFKLSTDGDAVFYATLHDFAGGSTDGRSPNGTLVFDGVSTLYGTTAFDGAGFAGTVFSLDTSGTPYSLLHEFSLTDGGSVYGGLVLDGGAGILYGTTHEGGGSGFGTVFSVDTLGTTFTTIHDFSGIPDGSHPRATLVLDGSKLYGTTFDGGSSDLGSVFKLATDGSTESVLSFAGGSGDGSHPFAGLVSDGSGNLYGATVDGSASGWGLVFKVDASFVRTDFHSFGAGGFQPFNNLIVDGSGHFYGTTSGAGTFNNGTVFELDPVGNETVLHSFNGTDGSSPLLGALTRDASGNLYGATVGGGATGNGVAFKLDSGGTYTILHDFTGAGDGSFPYGGFALDSGGVLYGTTLFGGAFGRGTIFAVASDGSFFTTRHDFAGAPADGANSYAGLVLDSGGNLYGTTFNGGSSDQGAIFKLASDDTLTLRFSFSGPDGTNPEDRLLLASDGTLYGTTWRGGPAANSGTVFKLTPSGTHTLLYSFSGGADGYSVVSGVVRDAAGNLYGTTDYGGTSDKGTVYKVAPDSTHTILHSFTGGDGAYPSGGVIFDNGGNLVGTAQYGGPTAGGVAYSITLSPSVSLEQSAPEVTEGSLGATIQVLRVGDTSGTVTVDYGTAAGTAVNPGDFGARFGTLTFGPGVTSQTISIPVFDDVAIEGDETFSVFLGSPVGATIEPPGAATVTIHDNDAYGTVQFSSATYSHAETGSAIITVTRTVPLGYKAAAGVTVQYATSNGSAGLLDYTGVSGTLSFGLGVTTKTFAVPILGDPLAEGDETVNLSLSIPVNATLGAQSTAALTITDNDAYGTVQFKSASFSYGESGLQAITVTRTVPAGMTAAAGATVDYATSNGSALAGLDYTGVSGTLSFGLGVLSKTFTVPILSDTLVEGNETVNLTLSNPGNAALGAQSTATLTIMDNDAYGTVQFSSATYSHGESGSATITVRRTVPAGKTAAGGVTVDYATSDGTATAGPDYTTKSGTLSFGVGVLTRTFTVPIKTDAVVDPNETVDLALSNVVNGGPGAPTAATLTITEP